MNEITIINKSNLLGKEIDVYGTFEEPLFLANDVAEWIGHSNVTEMLRNIDEDEKLHSIIFRAGQNRQCNFLTENGVYEVLMQSRKPIAKQFKKGIKEILKTIRKTGSYSVNNTFKDKVEGAMVWVRGISDLLRLNDTSKLALVKQVAEPLGLPTPSYIQSKGVLKSAKELLKTYDCGISSIAFNKLAVKAGLLEDKTRNSSHGEIKHFKSITEKGSMYGENQINPNNPKETQPLWYEDKFGEVIKIIGL